MPLAILTFLVAIAFVPEIAGAAIAPRWAVIAIGVSALLIARSLVVRDTSKTDVGMWTLTRVGTLFVLWSFLSVIWTPVLVDGIFRAWQMLFLAGAFYLGSLEEDLDRVYAAAACGAGISALIAIPQWFGWALIPQDTPPAGLFINKNLMGEFCVLALAGVLFSARYAWLSFAPALGGLLAYSKASWLAAALVLAGYAAMRMPRSRAIPAAFVLAIAALLGVRYGLQTYGSLYNRFDVWTDTINGLTLWGRGLGSYYVAMPEYGFLTGPTGEVLVHAHNDFLEVLFENGLPGLVLFAILVVGCLRTGPESSRAVICALIVIMCFGFPFYVPATAFLAAVTAGHLARHRFEFFSAVALRRADDAGSVAERPGQAAQHADAWASGAVIPFRVLRAPHAGLRHHAERPDPAA